MPPKNRPQAPRGKEQSKQNEFLTTEGSAAPTRTRVTAELEPNEKTGPEIVQEHPADAPPGWSEVQDKLAAASGLSVLLVDGRQPPALVASNNNSICHAFQSSLEYVSLCDPYCGDAHRRALSAGSTVQYKCHAGLQCFTTPVEIGGEQNLAAIGGRAFVNGADYRSLVDRFRAGELNDLLESKPFDNVIFAESGRLDQLSERLQKAARNFDKPTVPRSQVSGPTVEVQSPKSKVQGPPVDVESPTSKVATLSASVEGSKSKVETPSADVATPSDTIESPSDTGTAGVSPASSQATTREVQTPSDAGIASVPPTSSLTTPPSNGFETEISEAGISKKTSETPAIPAPPERPSILQLEVDRLRGELEHRSQLAESLQRFLERISTRDPEKTYSAILHHSKQLLQAERLSLMVFDESSNEITLKAAVGLATAESEVGATRLGEGISGEVLESGTPLVVSNLEISGLTPAPAERKYRTKSFISYPITMRGRKIGVLNVTDKTAGGTFDDVDLSMLEIVGPQIAVALERAEWQERATQFQLMSITDPLTGLLNRRYLEERLTEELNRSQRYNYSMSVLMIDIDDFKSYNDRNGHQAGDVALRTTAHALKATLRSADVACRYGGEEFCILLPQTSLSEAGVIAERMRLRVAETDYPYGKSQPLGNVSVSIGISTFAKDIDTAHKIIAAADQALYSAKRGGKNRLEFYVDNLTSSFVTK